MLIVLYPCEFLEFPKSLHSHKKEILQNLLLFVVVAGTLLAPESFGCMRLGWSSLESFSLSSGAKIGECGLLSEEV